MKYKGLLVMLVLGLLVAVSPTGIMAREPAATETQSPPPLSATVPAPAEPLTIGMIYISPIQIPWSAAHLEGLREALTAYAESVGAKVEPDGEAYRVVASDGRILVKVLSWTSTTDFSSAAALHATEDMIKKGARLIFVTAENWCVDLVDTTAKDHPEVNFACIRGPVAPNVISMYTKGWQGFSLACAAAAAVVKEPKLGLMGAYENNPQVVSNLGACAASFIDAWHLLGRNGEPGISKVWTNSWGSEPDEMMAAESLADAGATVIAVHQDSTAAAEALANRNPRVWVVGYDRDWSKFTTPSDHILTSVVLDWSEVYNMALQSTLTGDFAGIKWNPGIDTSAVTLAPFSPQALEYASGPIIDILAHYTQKLSAGWIPCGDNVDMWSIDDISLCLPK